MADDYFSLMRRLEEDVLLEWEKREPGSGEPSPQERWVAFSEIAPLLNLRRAQFRETLRDILRAAVILTGAERALLLLRDDADRMRVELAMSGAGKEIEPAAATYSRSVVQWVADQREAVRIRDVRDGSAPIDPSASMDEMGLISILCAPLHIPLDLPPPPGAEQRRYSPDRGGMLLGILYVDDTRERRVFPDEIFLIFKTLASFASTVILNARFFRELITDPQTGLVHRREFGRFLQTEVSRARRTAKPLGVVLVGVEAYQNWIREHGWLGARSRMRDVATRIREIVRSNDVVGHHGGSRMSLILPATDPAGVEAVCQKIAATSRPLALDIRAGYACFPAHASEPETLLRMAEAALVRARTDGSPYVSFDSDMGPPLFRTGHAAGLFSGNPGDDIQQVEFLLDTLFTVAGTSEREQLFKVLGEKLLDVSGAERIAILVPEGKDLACRYAADWKGGRLTPGPALWGDIPQAVATRGVPLHFDLRLGTPDAEGPHPAAGVLHAIACPIQLRAGTGVCYLDSREADRSFGDREFAFVVALARESSLALQIAELVAELGEANEALAADKARVETANVALRDDLQSKAEVVRRLEAQVGRAPGAERFGTLVGQSIEMKELFRTLERVKDSREPVLIIGESGTGKELIARSLHQMGPRARAPFVGENCAAVPPDLLESELFGHTKGAFTGADRAKEGLVQAASGGTLFLDEVGDMPIRMQKDLLRVIQEREVRPVGGREPVAVDVRIIAATHRDLEKMAEEGSFRHDLYYRLNVIRIAVPPLRARQDDIPLLVKAILERIGGEAREAPRTISGEAMDALAHFDWPGNVRQLENELRRAVALHAGEIALDHLSPEIAKARKPKDLRFASTFKRGLKEMIERYEETVLSEVLRMAGGDKSKAAKLLQISRRTLYTKLERYGLM